MCCPLETLQFANSSHGQKCKSFLAGTKPWPPEQFHGSVAVTTVGSLSVRGFLPDQISLIHFMSLTELLMQFDFYSAIVQLDELFCLMAASSRAQFSIM